jgi:type II secretory pathway pseudopilin PulG
MLSAHMNETEDPWAKARTSQRDDVAAALAPRERRCPSCGAVQRDGGRRCSNCGADLTARAPRRIPWRALLIAGAAVLVVAAIALPVIAGLRDDAADEREREQQRQAELREAERARQVRDARPVRADGPAAAAGEDTIAHRARLLERAEALITTDARRRVAAGTLDGDIKGTECDLFPATDARRAAEDDPATAAGRYDCVAFTSKLEGNQQRTAVFGHPFWLVIDYRRDSYVWCKVTPRAGEGGSVLVSVPVPAPCRDPAGPG